MKRVSILLADDNASVLVHVTKVLEVDYHVVAAAKDGSSVLAECQRLKPDIVVLDISMGGLNGIEIAGQLRDMGCRSKIVFLTVHEDSDFLKAAIGAGASAYVVKSRLSQDLSLAIQAVLSNKLFVSETLLYRAP